MGVRGAAIATIISQGGAFLTAIIYLNRTHKLVKLQLLKLVFDWKIFWQSVRIGVPSGLQHTFVSFGMVAILRIVNTFGTSVIAAYSVAGRIDSLAMLPAMNFGQALSTFVGQNIGANKKDRVREGLKATLKMSILVSVILTIIIVAFRYQLMHLFTPDSKVVNVGIDYLVIVSSCYILFSLMFTMNGLLRGAGDTIIPMFITLLSLWLIRIPLASLLSGRFYIITENLGIDINLPTFLQGSLEERGIWWSVPVAWLFGAICSYIYYRTGSWKKQGVVKYKESSR
jgi:putative MATE family efflux protein